MSYLVFCILTWCWLARSEISRGRQPTAQKSEPVEVDSDEEQGSGEFYYSGDESHEDDIMLTKDRYNQSHSPSVIHPSQQPSRVPTALDNWCIDAQPFKSSLSVSLARKSHKWTTPQFGNVYATHKNHVYLFWCCCAGCQIKSLATWRAIWTPSRIVSMTMTSSPYAKTAGSRLGDGF